MAQKSEIGRKKRRKSEGTNTFNCLDNKISRANIPVNSVFEFNSFSNLFLKILRKFPRKFYLLDIFELILAFLEDIRFRMLF